MTSLSATYYVSQRTGSDENDGRTCSTAFASLSAINRRHLQPGDRILLERGSVFYGQYLHVTDSGTKEAPIVIGAYGTADAPPRIDACGQGIWYQDYGCAPDSPTHVHHGWVFPAAPPCCCTMPPSSAATSMLIKFQKYLVEGIATDGIKG